jgi:hypothetical protein
MDMNPKKQVAGRYDKERNILHLWFPQPVSLDQPESVAAFFDEVVANWIDKTPGRFYLLVNYTNLHIAPSQLDSYAKNIGRFQHRLLGTFRYQVSKDFTGVAVSLGNIRHHAPANIFPDEASAREAIRQAKLQAG